MLDVCIDFNHILLKGIVESMLRQNQFIVNLKIPRFVNLGDTHFQCKQDKTNIKGTICHGSNPCLK